MSSQNNRYSSNGSEDQKAGEANEGQQNIDIAQNAIESRVDTTKDVKDECKEEEDDDEDKLILMELIAQKNQQLEEEQQILDQINQNLGSQISLSRMKSQPSESIHISALQLGHQISDQQIAIPGSLTSLARKRYISTEIEQLINNNNTNNNDDAKNIPSYTNKRQNNYAAKAAYLNNQPNPDHATNPSDTETPQVMGIQGINQPMQFKQPLPRNQIQYQSGLSSSQSLRDYHIYFRIQETSSRSGSSNNESYEHDEESLMMTAATGEPIKVPMDDMHDDATVQYAIHSAICQINDFLHMQKYNIRLAQNEILYDLYLAKKNGEKKSLPALDPFEKVKKFGMSNMVLMARDASAIIKPKVNKEQSEKGIGNNSVALKPSGNDQFPTQTGKHRDVIKEVSESMISNKSVDITNGNNGGSNSIIKQRNTSSFMGYPNQHSSHQNTRRSIQSTITPKQTKIENEEKDTTGDIQLPKSSKWFSFMCCMRETTSQQSSSSSNNKNNNNSNSKNSSNSKKRPTIVSS